MRAHSSFPTLAAALEALEPFKVAERAADKAHSAAEAEEAALAAKLRATLEVIGAVGLQTREEIIAFVGGDPGRAKEPLAALKKFEAAKRRAERAERAWQKKRDALDVAHGAILTVPADPATALEKALAFMAETGCRVTRGVAESRGDDENLHRVLGTLINDLSQPVGAPTPPADFAALVAARDAAEQALVFEGEPGWTPELSEARREVFDQASTALLDATTSDPAAIARKIFEYLGDDIGTGRMSAAEKHNAILAHAEEGGPLDTWAPALAYRDLIRLAQQPADPVAAHLAAADEARGDDEDAAISDGYWTLLDANIPVDATTPQGLLWRVARASHKADVINQNNPGDLNEELAEFVVRELNSIARTLVRMGAKNTLAIAGNFVHGSLEVGGPSIPAPQLDGTAYQYALAEAAYDKALRLTEGPGVTDEQLDDASDLEVRWLHTAAPDLFAVIKKMECEEAHRDSMGLRVDGQITEAGDQNRVRGFLCPEWIEHIEQHGDGSDRARLAIFRDLLRLAGVDDHPALPRGEGRLRDRSNLEVVVMPEQVRAWQIEDQARQWLTDYRANGGDLGPGPNGSIWIGTPLDDTAKEQACEAAQRELTSELRAAVRTLVAAEPLPADLTPDLGIEFIGPDQPDRQIAALVGAMG